MRQCPRCASEITPDMKKCPRCGLPISSMNFEETEIKNHEEELEKIRLKKLEEKRKNRAEKRAKRKENKKNFVSDTDFAKYATNSPESENLEVEPLFEGKKFKFRNNRKKKKDLTPEFQIDENGKFDIDTSSSRIIDDATQKLIDENRERVYGKTNSVKKERGDYRPEHIKWWELYKWADRLFARRKIKKEVNKAAKIKPSFVKKWKLLTFAIFFGWCGAHNFYAKNKKKAWVSLICSILFFGIVIFSEKWPFLKKIQISVGGGSGAVALFIWITDVVNICFNNFKYRVQKEAFIFNLNIKTRAELGEKYIDLELYKKPWWVRFKAWCKRVKRNFEEFKHDVHQDRIDRKKRKLAREARKMKEQKVQDENDLIRRNDEINKNADSEKSKEEKIKSAIGNEVLKDIDSFGNSQFYNQSNKQNKVKAKFSKKNNKKNKKKK